MIKPKKSDAEWSIAEKLEAWSERSLTIPIFVVEGPSDVVIYREIAKHRSLEHLLAIEPSDEKGGGRTTIFQLYDASSANLYRKYNVVFFADQDLYVFGSIPEQYKKIHFTNGYTIENDLFEDGRDWLIQKLYPEERPRFDEIVRNVALWFAFEVNLVFSSKAAEVKFDISLLNELILRPNGHQLSPSFLAQRNFTPPPQELADRISEDYSRFLRGKFLFHILLRLSMDRTGKNPIRIGTETTLWNDCLIKGLENFDATTNCNRIASIMQSAISSP